MFLSYLWLLCLTNVNSFVSFSIIWKSITHIELHGI